MPQRHDFLVEIGTEELPPRALPRLAAAFAEGVRANLDEAGLKHESIEIYATPRRLALLVRELPTAQAEREVERRGPPAKLAFDDTGQPTAAALGFAKTCGVGVADLQRIDTAKGEWLVHRAIEPGKKTTELLSGIVSRALDRLPIPKRMRWGSGSVEFVRPVHWVVLLYDREPIEAQILAVSSGGATRGHRFHAPAPIVLKRPAEYAAILEKKGRVIADFAERRARIREQVVQIAKDIGGEAVINPALLDEVTALTEWPIALAGRFDEEFLKLPDEVLIATLEDHQRSFAVRSANGELLDRFISISNIDSKDPEKVREGNERVVRPRLADAGFFWETDRKRTLHSRLDELKGIVFQERLGTIFDKTQRVKSGVEEIAPVVGADKTIALRAADLAKCDLVTQMVNEFPELQGIMGSYYAQHDGEAGEVAQAIEEHYRPRFAGDALPLTPAGRAVAIADKLDTIVGVFAIGQPPTGTKDPYGLRRNALGVLRMLIELQLDLDLHAAIRHAVSQLPVDVDHPLIEQIFDYMMERLRAYYLDPTHHTGITPDMFEAVIARRPYKPLDFHARLNAVRQFVALDEATSLATANKRIVNILKKSDADGSREPDTAKLIEPAERDLHARMTQLRSEVEPLLAERRYGNALTRLASLREPVDAFFDNVLVMDEDKALRDNRLALLDQLRQLFLHTADLSRLHIDT